MTKTSSPKEIEEALTENRAELSQTLRALQERLGLQDLTPTDIGRGLVSGINIARHTARKHPKLTLAAGAGVALFLLGRRSVASDDDLAVEKSVDLGGDDWFILANSLAVKAQQDIARIDEDSRLHAESRNLGLSTLATDDRAFKAERSAVRDGLAEDLDCAFRFGLDHLSDSAQDEMVALRAEEYTRQTQGQSLSLVGIVDGLLDHPLAAGAVALAIGGILTAMRKHAGEDDSDDELYRAERERLMRKARQLAEQERDIAVKLAELASAEVLATANRKTSGKVEPSDVVS